MAGQKKPNIVMIIDEDLDEVAGRLDDAIQATADGLWKLTTP